MLGAGGTPELGHLGPGWADVLNGYIVDEPEAWKPMALANKAAPQFCARIGCGRTAQEHARSDSGSCGDFKHRTQEGRKA